jgi:hypothetical protein
MKSPDDQCLDTTEASKIPGDLAQEERPSGGVTCELVSRALPDCADLRGLPLEIPQTAMTANARERA